MARNLITDVAGLRVGHADDHRLASGSTVILFDEPAIAGVDVRGGGPGSRDTELLDCYAAADVFVFASRTETQGLVLLEAMAQGTPVVSTAELGTRSILVPESGALVVPEEAGEFAAAAVRVLRDARRRAELSARGRAYARGWSSAAMARRLAELYGQLCARHAGVRASVNHFT